MLQNRKLKSKVVLPMAIPYHALIYPEIRRSDRAFPERRESPSFVVIAHRGASACCPENTLSAFQTAMDMKADMVELDVQLTADREIVVFHDENLSRCTDGRGRVSDHSFARLRELDAGAWFHKKFAGERIPALAEVLALCRGRIAVNIEVKTEAVTDAVSGGIEERCLKMVDQTGMRGHVVYSSFDSRAVLHFKQIDREVPVAVLYEKKRHGSHLPSEIVRCLGADAFNCSRRELSAKRLEDLKRSGIPVHVYTVNDEKSMRRLLDLGVDGIFTNRPDVLRRVWEDDCRKKREAGAKDWWMVDRKK